MANIKSQIKRIGTNKKAQERNKAVKSELKTAVRHTREAITAAGLVPDLRTNVPEALLGMDNVVLQPHRASATVETRLAMGELVLANLAAWALYAAIRLAGG